MDWFLQTLKGRITVATLLTVGLVGVLVFYQNCAKPLGNATGGLSQAASVIVGELPNNSSQSGWTNMNGNALLLHLDEPGGSTSWTDSSGNGNGAICNGNFCPLVGSAFGYLGNGIQFDGLSTYLQIPISNTSALANFMDTSFSLMLWANPQALPLGTDCAAGAPGNTCSSFLISRVGWHTGIYYSTSGNFASTFFTGNSPDRHTWIGFGTTAPTVSPPGTWYHVVMVVDDAAKKESIYINGALAASTSYTGVLAKYISNLYTINGVQYIAPLFIGAGIPADFEASYGQVPPSSTTYYNGLIDEVAAFSRTLSSTEIQLIYNTQLANHH